MLTWLAVLYTGPAIAGLFLVSSAGGEIMTGAGLTVCFWVLISLWARHLLKMRVVLYPAAVEFFDPIRVKTHVVAYSMIDQTEYRTHRWFRFIRIRAREKAEFEIPDFFRDFDTICEAIEERRGRQG